MENVSNENIEILNTQMENTTIQEEFFSNSSNTKDTSQTQEVSETSEGSEIIQTYEIIENREILQNLDNLNKQIEYNNAISFILLALISFTLFVKIIISTFKDFQ